MISADENKKTHHLSKRPLATRVVIYPKDIQQLTGKSYRHALNLNQEIRAFFQKEKHQFLTVYEFADYTGILPEIILTHLK